MINYVIPPHRASVCTLVFLVYLISYSSGEYETREAASGGVSDDRTPGNEFGSCSDGKCVKRTTQDVTSGMWFGPRLGRRRRSDKKSEAEPDIEALTNVLDGTRWAVITIPGGAKRRPTQFTPRLGRESGEEFFSYGNSKDQEEADAEESVFPPLFASRLGRRLPWAPSPRLGRQLNAVFERPRQYSGEPRF